jgi:GTPase
VDDQTFVVADIQGLIAGAHLGHGLGTQFLRHIERTRLLVHLVDVSATSGRDPVEDFRVVMEELASFGEDLAKKPMFIAASKIDVAQEPESIARLRTLAATKGLPFFEISSVTGQGIEGLKYEMAQFLSKPVEEEIRQETKQD